ncbi:hypothetical protein GCM10011428_45820 [Streptomyces violaceus]
MHRERSRPGVREELDGLAVRCDATGAQKRDPVRVGRDKPQVVHHHDHRVTGVRP